MATALDRIHTRLTGEAALTAILTGGIYKRELKRSGPGSTPDAFGPEGQPRPAAVVVDRGDITDTLGPDAAFFGAPEVWFYAGAYDNGRATIEAAWELAFGLLHRWRFPTVNGTAVEARVVGRLGVRDDPAMDGRLLDTMRLQTAGLWRNTD